MFGRSKDVLGLDVGSHTIKVVELEEKGGELNLVNVARARIESADLLEDTLEQLLDEADVGSKRVVAAVSGRSVIVRYVPMPPMPDEELRSAIKYEADKYIPFEVQDVVLDCQRLDDGETASGEQMRVLLVAVKRSVIDELVTLLENVGLTPYILDVDVFALGNAFELRNRRLNDTSEDIRGLVDIGAAKTNICIMKGNSVYFTREIYMAGNDMTEAVAKRFGQDPTDVEGMKIDPGTALETMQEAMQPVLEDIGSEIRLSFDYYENQFDQEVREVYLSGGAVMFSGVDNMLSNIFNLQTKTWDPTEALDISNPHFDPAILDGTNSDFAVAIGLASRLMEK